MPVRHVAYAAYGSNLSRPRLFRYLAELGTPEGDVTCLGWQRLAHRLWFGGTSVLWGGGVALVDPEPAPDHWAWTRRHRMPVEAFLAVLSAEAGGAEVGPDLLDAVAPGGAVGFASNGKYDLLRRVDDGRDDLATYTFTSAGGLEPNPPTPAYVAVIRGALEDDLGLTPTESAVYLRERGVPSDRPDEDERPVPT